MSIPFVQHLLPDGDKEPTELKSDPKIEKVANALVNLGCEFHIEILTTNQVSMTCEVEIPEGVALEPILAIEVVPAKDKAVAAGLRALVKEAAAEFKRRRKEK